MHSAAVGWHWIRADRRRSHYRHQPDGLRHGARASGAPLPPHRSHAQHLAMIVVRFKMQSHPDKVDEVRSLLTDVAVASQAVEGVVSFDIGQDVTDSNSFVATEVFDDREALDRQESLPQVAAAMAAFEEALTAEPEATIFNVASPEPYE
jgi:quinol monooxygenase YgiN